MRQTIELCSGLAPAIERLTDVWKDLTELDLAYLLTVFEGTVHYDLAQQERLTRWLDMTLRKKMAEQRHD